MSNVYFSLSVFLTVVAKILLFIFALLALHHLTVLFFSFSLSSSFDCLDGFLLSTDRYGSKEIERKEQEREKTDKQKTREKQIVEQTATVLTDHYRGFRKSPGYNEARERSFRKRRSEKGGEGKYGILLLAYNDSHSCVLAIIWYLQCG